MCDPAAERPVSEEPRPDAGGRGLFQTGLQQASASALKDLPSDMLVLSHDGV